MRIDGRHCRTIWLNDDGWSVNIIDQTKLPHSFEVVQLTCAEEAGRAIKDMLVRGAPLIGATAAYGLCLALRADASGAGLDRAIATLASQRPTAINLHWALQDMRLAVQNLSQDARLAAGLCTGKGNLRC